MNAMTIDLHTSFQNKLRDIIEAKPNTLKAAVAQIAIKEDDPELFLGDVLAHGCISGVVGSMIYHCDTHAFYDRHYDEIEELRLDWEDETGQPIEIKGDLKNFLAWFAFEHAAFMLIHELEG